MLFSLQISFNRFKDLSKDERSYKKSFSKKNSSEITLIFDQSNFNSLNSLTKLTFLLL